MRDSSVENVMTSSSNALRLMRVIRMHSRTNTQQGLHQCILFDSSWAWFSRALWHFYLWAAYRYFWCINISMYISQCNSLFIYTYHVFLLIQLYRLFRSVHKCDVITSLLISGLILVLRPANERRRYFVTTSLIGWVQAWNQPCDMFVLYHH